MIVSARRRETVSTVTLSGFRVGSTGTVSVMTSPVIPAAATRPSVSASSRRVGHEHPDLLRAVLEEHLRAGDLRPARRRHVVADHGDLVAHTACDLDDPDLLVSGPRLVHDREVGRDHLGELERVLRAPGIRRDRDDAIAGEPQVAEVLREQRQRRHVVDGDREEALDLPGVEVHRQNAVGAGQLEHVGDEPRRRSAHAASPCGPGGSRGTTG